MSGIRLETQADRACEERVIERLETLTGLTYVPLPPYSAVDYVAIGDLGVAVELVEVKTRKEKPTDIERFGGLLLKQRKAEEMALLSSLLRLPATVVFGFENGEGELMAAGSHRFTGKEPVLTGRRDRNLATDEEPVVLLNWPWWPDADLELVAT